MIDPTNITNFNRTQEELEKFFLFCVSVAGKTAYIQANKLEQFLKPATIKNITPFEYLSYLNENNILEPMIREAKLGQYKRLTRIFKQCISLNLEKVSIDELEKIPGIGPKTSRFFILHSRPNQELAVLDTHILSWLNQNINDKTIPKSTPQSYSRYKTLEKLFLNEAKKRNIKPEIFDLQIWNNNSRVATI